ncbi:MAG: nuclear transport factor 2 family protein [Candidatus Latescibacterota bacterium]
MTTRDVVERYFEYINSGNWDAWVALFSEKIVIDEAISGHMEGLAAVRQSAEGIRNGFERFENKVEELVVEGDRAMVVCRIDAVIKGGVPLVSAGANFYRVAGGKIAYMSSFHDSAPFMKAFAQVQQAK